MSVFTRTQNDGTWITGYKPPAADYADLDAKTFAALNGDKGGAWAPSSVIEIGGAGGVQITGRTRVGHGGRLRTLNTSRIVLADGDWPRFSAGHALRSRSLVTSVAAAHTSMASTSWSNGVSYRYEDWLTDVVGDGVVSIGLLLRLDGETYQQPDALVAAPYPLRVALRVHDGGRLTKATFHFRVTTERTVAPKVMPKFRVYRADQDGVITLLKSTASGADADGYTAPALVSSGTAWWAGGAVQTFEYVCDQNNVIDVSQYEYWAEIVEESLTNDALSEVPLDGTLARQRYRQVHCATTGILAAPLSGGMTIDGYAVATGNRVLVMHGVDNNPATQNMNGIWIVDTGGAWTRATDFDEVRDLSPHAYVIVRGGNTLRGSMWELRSPLPVTVKDTSAGSPIHFDPLTPRGNKYHSVVCDFDSIADMRPQ